MASNPVRPVQTIVNTRGGVLLWPYVMIGWIGQLGDRMNKLTYSRASQLVIDGFVVAVALGLAYFVRFDGELPAVYQKQFFIVMPFAILLNVGVNYLAGSYELVWRFFGMKDAALVARSVGLSTVASLTFRFFDTGLFNGTVIPVGVLLSQPLFTYSGFLSARLARRIHFHRSRPTEDIATVRRRLLLVGAGEAGLHLLRELSQSQFKVVGFLDDDMQLKGRTIGGWRVLGTTDTLESVVATYRVHEVVLCMPSAPQIALARIVRRCATLGVKTSSVPTLTEIMSGTAAIGHLRAVNMEDLLGRASIKHPKNPKLTRTYAGHCILVTGAGGSIGSELVRQLKELEPSRLILLDKDENNLYETACEIRESFSEIIDVVTDIRDLGLMRKVFDLHKPDIVFHAAAYKHVPLMEHHPAEAILNNVIGTRNLVEISHACDVKKFVLISTDKAVNPTSTMGASKRVAEMIVQERASAGTRTLFCCVRFGNVLGSRASVVPLFQRQIRTRRKITVTHPEVRRYFMTIPEAVQLVIQAGSLGRRGEIFLLDMGDPVKIVDLAQKLIELSGLTPDKDVQIEFTGLRPGEKLNEELLISGEQRTRTTQYSKIFRVEALERDWLTFRETVKTLEDAAFAGDAARIREILRSLCIGYQYEPPVAAALRDVLDEDTPPLTDSTERSWRLH